MRACDGNRSWERMGFPERRWSSPTCQMGVRRSLTFHAGGALAIRLVVQQCNTAGRAAGQQRGWSERDWGVATIDQAGMPDSLWSKRGWVKTNRAENWATEIENKFHVAIAARLCACPGGLGGNAVVSKPQSEPVVPPGSSQTLSLPDGGLATWFAEEVQPHERSLRSYLRSVFPALPDIDDFVQESYARLIRARQSGHVSYAKAFLFTTARNAALDFLRRRKVVSIEGMADLSMLRVVEERPDAADAVNKQQELALLADAVRGLPERCRQVVTLRMLYGMSHKEIASELRISDQTVKAQLAKGTRRCSEFLAARGLP